MLAALLLTHLLSLPGQVGASLFSPLAAVGCSLSPGGLDQCLNVINNPINYIISSILQGPFSFVSWLLQQLFSTTNFNLNVACATGGGGNCIYYRLWQVGLGVGTGVLVVAAALRAMRELTGGERARVSQAIFGTLVRFIVVLGAMNVSYVVLAWASTASFNMYGGLYSAFASISTTAMPSGSPVSAFTTFANDLQSVGWLAVVYVLDFIGIIYVTWLVLVARFVLLIGTGFAPIVIALSVYSEKTAIFIWWTRKMIGAILVPMFAGAIMGATTAIVWNLKPVFTNQTSVANIWQPVNPAIALNLIFACVVFVGGCWFLGQAIKHTTGINLGAHSLSTMVAGGYAIRNLAGPAQAAFGLGAGAMNSIGGLHKGSSGDSAAASSSVAAQLVGGGQVGVGSPLGGGGLAAESVLLSQPQSTVQSFVGDTLVHAEDGGVSVMQAALGPEGVARAAGGAAAGSPEYQTALVNAYLVTPNAETDFSKWQLKQPIVRDMA